MDIPACCGPRYNACCGGDDGGGDDGGGCVSESNVKMTSLWLGNTSSSIKDMTSLNLSPMLFQYSAVVLYILQGAVVGTRLVHDW